jgi:hypothetical protein
VAVTRTTSLTNATTPLRPRSDRLRVLLRTAVTTTTTRRTNGRCPHHLSYRPATTLRPRSDRPHFGPPNALLGACVAGCALVLSATRHAPKLCRRWRAFGRSFVLLFTLPNPAPPPTIDHPLALGRSGVRFLSLWCAFSPLIMVAYLHAARFWFILMPL